VSLPLDGAASARPLVAKGLGLEAGDDGRGVVHLDGHGYAVLDLAAGARG
jgi:maltose alpha-D-glucosyltransferase/alpha-amylase